MYAYDPQLSIQLAKNHPELFEMRACYNNVYNMVMQHLEELTPREKLRILFCYRKGNGDEYYRHAFCLFDGKLVEPLLYLDMSDYNRRSIVPIREMSVSEYGPDRGPNTANERNSAQNNLALVVTDYRSRFSSFNASAPDQYASAISRAISAVLAVWLQFRNTFVPIPDPKEEMQK